MAKILLRNYMCSIQGWSCSICTSADAEVLYPWINSTGTLHNWFWQGCATNCTIYTVQFVVAGHNIQDVDTNITLCYAGMNMFWAIYLSAFKTEPQRPMLELGRVFVDTFSVPDHVLVSHVLGLQINNQMKGLFLKV